MVDAEEAREQARRNVATKVREADARAEETVARVDTSRVAGTVREVASDARGAAEDVARSARGAGRDLREHARDLKRGYERGGDDDVET